MDDTFLTQSSSSKTRNSVSHTLKNGGSTVARSTLGTRKYHFIAKDPNRFGNFSPMWTIPGGRQEHRPTVPTPGPGTYDISSKQFHSPSYVIEDRPPIDYRTDTSNIDFYKEHEFPQIKKISIGVRVPLKFYDPNIKAEPTLMYSDDDKWKSYNISERYLPPPPDEVPSPSRYHPNDPGKPRTIFYSWPKAGENEGSDSNSQVLEEPGPGAYNLAKPVLCYTNWAQSMIPKNKRYIPPEKKNAEKPWIVKKPEPITDKRYIEFETLDPPQETKKEDVSNNNNNSNNK